MGGSPHGYRVQTGVMSNPDRDPGELVCEPGDRPQAIEIISPREVPLGGLRAMPVRRTLPSRQRSLVGAWCFLDHYGPDLVAETGGMTVAPHPHTGLQTVSWLFSGEIEHRDSAGFHANVRPGEVNLMTAGRGISHSEVSTPSTTTLHGAQLWVALPEGARHTDPTFEHYAPECVTGDGWEARVFLGSLLGSMSPVHTHTPLLGAELRLTRGATLTLDVNEAFEHALLVDAGLVSLEGQELKPNELGYAAPARTSLELTAYDDSTLLLLGGEPFGESIVMWWNFVGRSHEEIVTFRDEWQSQIDGVADSQDVRAGRFGTVIGDLLPPIPAPALPNARLKERR